MKFSFRFDEIQAYLQQKAKEYPGFVTMSIKGKTTENRNMIVMKLGNSPKGSETPAVWFDAGKCISVMYWIAYSKKQRFLWDNDD